MFKTTLLDTLSDAQHLRKLGARMFQVKQLIAIFANVLDAHSVSRLLLDSFS